jgi:hypothetical protein
MIGEVEPLKALQDPICSPLVIERVLREYPGATLRPEETFYRIRKAPCSPDQSDESVFDTSSSSTTERLLRPH